MFAGCTCKSQITVEVEMLGMYVALVNRMVSLASKIQAAT